jgi:hypothetical protein
MHRAREKVILVLRSHPALMREPEQIDLIVANPRTLMRVRRE